MHSKEKKRAFDGQLGQLCYTIGAVKCCIFVQSNETLPVSHAASLTKYIAVSSHNFVYLLNFLSNRF